MCTYSCVYCQLGRISNVRVERRPFYRPLEIAGYLASLPPSTAYLSIPTRPPAETSVRAVDEQTLSGKMMPCFITPPATKSTFRWAI
jgi:wyosine [tRNA(Phe)-imidazoG37] synthetase (radical SAM superfamily)